MAANRKEAEGERDSFMELVFKTHPKEQLLFILLGCAGEWHQIVLLSAQIAYAQLLCRGSVSIGTSLYFSLCFCNN